MEEEKRRKGWKIGAEAIMHSRRTRTAHMHARKEVSRDSYASRPSRTFLKDRMGSDGKDTHGELDQQYARQFG